MPKKKEDLSIGKVSKIPRSEAVKCSVDGCEHNATHEVILYDVYPYNRDTSVFFEQDTTCNFICPEHLHENEQQAQGERRYRGHTSYPYTNKHGAQGYTIYRPLA
jgi:hypothetical protein